MENVAKSQSDFEPHAYGEYLDKVPAEHHKTFSTPTRMGSIHKVIPALLMSCFRSPFVWGVLGTNGGGRRHNRFDLHAYGEYLTLEVTSCQVFFRSPRVWKVFFNL